MFSLNTEYLAPIWPWEWVPPQILHLKHVTHFALVLSLVSNRQVQGHRSLKNIFKTGWWRKKGQPTSVFLPGKSHEQRSLGSQRVRHDWVTNTAKEGRQLLQDKTSSSFPSLLLLLSFFIKYLLISITNETLLGIRNTVQRRTRQCHLCTPEAYSLSRKTSITNEFKDKGNKSCMRKGRHYRR